MGRAEATDAEGRPRPGRSIFPNRYRFRRKDIEQAAKLRPPREALAARFGDTVSAAETAEILGMHKVTVSKLTKEGKLPAVSGPGIGGHAWYRYRRKDIEEVARQQRK